MVRHSDIGPEPGKRYWANIIEVITSPIGIFALVLLIALSMLSIVLVFSGLSQEKKWDGFCMMFWLIVGTIALFGAMVIFRAKYLVYGERGHIEESKQRTELEKLRIMKSKTDSDIAQG